MAGVFPRPVIRLDKSFDGSYEARARARTHATILSARSVGKNCFLVSRFRFAEAKIPLQHQFVRQVEDSFVNRAVISIELLTSPLIN